jgi:hypothetical protein
MTMTPHQEQLLQETHDNSTITRTHVEGLLVRVERLEKRTSIVEKAIIVASSGAATVWFFFSGVIQDILQNRWHP